MPDPHDLDATVVITTKNRKESLRIALESAVRQQGAVQVLVVDDASDDGTSEMIRAEFPTVTLVRVEKSNGYILQRNHGAELARGRIIFSIDDDAAFTTDTVIQQVLAEFNHPRVGAVAIPFCNVNQSQAVYQTAPDATGIWCAQQFIGTAHALRRDLFLALGGYRAHYFHQGEERDWALRLLAAGYVVRMGRSDRIDHFESPKRDKTRMDTFGRRNDVLFIWHNTPALYLPFVLAKITLAGILFGFRIKRPKNMLTGLWRGYLGIFQYLSYRAPVPTAVWLLYRKLRQATRFADIESSLPPMMDVAKLQPVRQALGPHAR